MTNKRNTTFLLNFFTVFCLTVCMVLSMSITPSFSQEMQTAPSDRVSFGLGLMGAYHKMINDNEEHGAGKLDLGWSAGTGLVFEPMLTPNFGFHSGLWYMYTEYDFVNTGGFKAESTSHGLFFPVYALYSFNFEYISIGLLAGLNMAYFTEILYMDYDVTMYLNYAQLGAGAGFEFKFHVGKFVDIFLTLTSEIFYTTFMNDRHDENYKDHVYWASVRTGVLMRAF